MRLTAPPWLGAAAWRDTEPVTASSGSNSSRSASNRNCCRRRWYRQYAQARLAEIEAARGAQAGRRQARGVRRLVETELLPRALVKRGLTYVWIDPVGRWLIVDAASSSRADEVIEQLKLSLGELPLALLQRRGGHRARR